jgi:hypothetical protein
MQTGQQTNRKLQSKHEQQPRKVSALESLRKTIFCVRCAVEPGAGMCLQLNCDTVLYSYSMPAKVEFDERSLASTHVPTINFSASEIRPPKQHVLFIEY